MRYLITGAGQIGTQLARDLVREEHEVVVLRRRHSPTPGAITIVGDAADRDALRRAASGAHAIFHCIHAPYSARAWRRELPHREAAVMDVANELGIPVVFPESVYAYGRAAQHLTETAPFAPVSPLGAVRAELLAARAAHRARTASVVASDLFGPTATPQGSVVLATLATPASAGRRCWALGDPDAPHAVTYLPDLTRAMIAAAPLAEHGGTILIAPTESARSPRQIASDAAAAAGRAAPPKVSRIPAAAFAICAPFAPAMRELLRQRYLWTAPSTLQPGRLSTEFALAPTPWDAVLDEWAAALSPARAARP